ncbi:DUF3617 domain-containing protein [Erythrobacter sp.]|uniref:DUF3617 domain-containing protein n=1 Tax=Erythrobacter sp. TaxID=1042 RepID=UPI0025D60DFA|nr:DUF3617 domain-containing protein [Erythrobacter sp.]
MRYLMAPALAALALASCGGETSADADGDGAVSAGEVASKVEAEGIAPEPGQYKATITMTGMDIPGMPAGMEGHGAGATTTTEYCLTEEDVAEGFEEMMKRGQNGECAYESFELAGGNMDAVMVCKTPDGDARMTMNGTATPTSSDFTATMALNVPDVGEGTMSFAAKHERIGDCPAQ